MASDNAVFLSPISVSQDLSPALLAPMLGASSSGVGTVFTSGVLAAQGLTSGSTGVVGRIHLG